MPTPTVRGRDRQDDPSWRDAVAIARSGLFDRTYYTQQIELDFDDTVDAAQHYLTTGEARGFNPSPAFSPGYYLRVNDDVRNSGTGALIHYLRYGKQEGRLPRPSGAAAAPRPLAPRPETWGTLAADPRLRARMRAAQRDTADTVDIVVPVYRGYHDTMACLCSVLAAPVRTPFRLVVIDDRSPEPKLSEALDALADKGLITLFRNAENLGFVGTVNRGMALSTARDVVLLNADTEVYGDWLDRLRAHAHGGDRVATVTPLSNNATIFSYPHYAQTNNQALELDFATLDALAASANAGTSIEVPTGVGFCFYIRRDALADIGPFDRLLFGKGYGEENDFCMRATERGWSNLAALDTFVRHTGEVSFATEADAGKRQGYARLIAAHPRYDRLIQGFIKRDAFHEGRSRLDTARFAHAAAGRGVLMIEHGWGGGIERHVDDLAAALAADGVATLIAAPRGDPRRSTLRHPTSDDYPNLPELDWADTAGSAATLTALGIAHVHVQSVVGLPYATVADMIESVRLAGIAYDYTIHDYAPICPRLTMIDWGGSYCASPSPVYCRTCIAKCGTQFGEVRPEAWRQSYRRLLDGARRLLVPDEDVAQRIATYLDLAAPVLVRPHIATHRPPRIAARPARPRATRRIGMIGAIGEHKGSRLLRLLCADALDRRLPLEFILYGYTDRREEEDFANLKVTGRYEEAAFADLHAADPCDLALFLSVWPETFSYTLDHAFANAIFPVAFDLGAIGRRIAASGFGHLLPLALLYAPQRLNDALLGIDIAVADGPIVEPGREWVSADAYYDRVGLSPA